MTETTCGFAGDREQAIVSYLYGEAGEGDRETRHRFEAHLPLCDRCRTELGAFNDVRASLGQWTPPGLTSDQPPPVSRRASWRDIPVWAQTAAALLCLGAAAGIANLDVQYGPSGLHLRTGWAAAPAPDPQGDPAAATTPWREEMTALEARLRDDIGRAATASAPGPPVVESPDVVRRVQLLVEESERRQQRELALRLGEVMRDVNTQRQTDLARIDRNIGAMQSNTGREMLRQRSEMLNYVTVRTASQRGQ